MGVRLVKYGLSGGTGTYKHDELENRELDDQHPISSITGLVEALDNVSGIDEALNTQSIDLTYIEETKSLSANVKISAENKNALVLLEDGLFSKESRSSLIEINQIAHGFINLNVLYLTSSNKYALASSAKKVTSEALGLVRVIDIDNFELITNGLYETDISAYTIGTPLFLSSTGTLITTFTSNVKVIKFIGTVVQNGILININEGFWMDDFEIITTIPSVPYNTTLAVDQTYPYLTVVDFNIDVPYNRFILRGFEVLMGRSRNTGSIPNKDAFHFSIRNSIYEPNDTTNFVKETNWQSGQFIGLKDVEGTVTAVVGGNYHSEGSSGFYSTGVEYEDFDGTYQVHLRIWCYGGTRWGASSNTIHSIKTYIQTIEE